MTSGAHDAGGQALIHPPQVRALSCDGPGCDAVLVSVLPADVSPVAHHLDALASGWSERWDVREGSLVRALLSRAGAALPGVLAAPVSGGRGGCVVSPEDTDRTVALLARCPALPDLSMVCAALERWEALDPTARTALRRALREIDYHARAVALAAGLVTEGE